MILTKTFYRLVILFTIGGVITLTSCNENIDIDYPNDKINSDDVFKDISTTKSALNYLYTRIRTTQLFSFGSTGLPYNLSLTTDELQFLGSNIHLMFTNEVDALNPSYSEIWWNDAYKDIYAINSFIEGLINSTFIKSVDKNQLLGEAYTLRALYYQTLAKIFGDIPYTVTTNFTQNTIIGKTSYSKVIELIENDLILALDLLDYSYRSNSRVYVNKTVAELLLSENYLLQKRYDKAEFFANNIVNNTLYQLESDLDMIFKKDAASTIFQISLGVALQATPQATLYLFSAVNSVSALTPLFVNTFDNNDLRKTMWINNKSINGITYYQPYKYKNLQNNTDEYGVFFRLEEAYFYLAEALTYQDKTLEAVQVLNKVLVKRGLTPLSLNLSKDDFIAKLLKEANKEFFTEGGHRFFDLKRNAKLQEYLIQSKATWKTRNSLFPIPESQILINKNLLPNNQGY